MAAFTALFTVSAIFGLMRVGASTISVDPVDVVESSAERLVLQLTLPDPIIDSVEMLDGNTYQMFSVEGAGYPPEGKPDVPVFIRSILVPNGRTVNLEVDPGDPEIFPNDILLNPVQAPYADLEDSLISDFVKDEETYAANDIYPGVWAEIGPVEVMRGQEMVEVRLYPYQHNPVEETLYIYPNLRVTINFEGDIQPIPYRLQSEIFEDIYRRKAINAEEILEAEKLAETPYEPKYGPYGWDYLIFTDPAFEQAANKLAAWKQKMGYKTLVTKVPKKWGAQDIKDALEVAYFKWDIPPQYVLFIGDAEHIPPFYKTWHIFNVVLYKGNKNTQGMVGTDLYYSTLESKETSMFKPDGDLVPDVLLGRLSVNHPYEAMDRVNAIINYEKNPPSSASFYDTVIMTAQFQDGGIYKYLKESSGIIYTEYIDPDNIEDRRFTQTTEDIAIFLGKTPVNKTVKRMYFADPGSDPQKWNDNNQKYQSFVNFNGKNTIIGANLPPYLLSGFQWNADATKIKTAINAGSFLVTHRDHGGRHRWSQPRLEKLDVKLLNNQDLLPVVWSFNCNTGWFDNETDFKSKTWLSDLTPTSDEAFSEYWERPVFSAISDHDYGAVGIVAPTRVSYSTYSDPLFMGMIEAIWPKYTNSSSTAKSLYQMGAVLNHGKDYMSQKTTSGITETLQLEGYHYFGDPSMEIRTEKPPLIFALAETPWYWPMHHYDLWVSVNWLDDLLTGPVKNAKVTLSNADIPADHWTSVTDEEGMAVFTDLKTSTAGVYDLTVSAANHIPVTTTIEVLPGPAGGIGLDAEVYPCESEITIFGADSDLSGAGGMPVVLTTSAGDSESLVLEETEMAGFFSGQLETGSGRENPGDMILQVNDGDIITALYEDEDDGSRVSALVEDSAEVDCQAPLFDGLEGITRDGCYAILKWNPADEHHGLVYYNVYRDKSPGPPIGEKIGSTWALSTSDYICSSGQTYYYVVRAEDAVGNEDGNINEGSAEDYELFLPLIYQQHQTTE